MSVAGLKYDPVLSLDTPAETKSGSYIYSGSAASFHDWEFRTRARVSQHRERQRREVLKDLRSSHQLSRSASPRKWVGGGIRSPDRHTGDESSGMAASPSSAPGRRRGRQAGAESMSSGDGGEEEQQPQDYEVEDDGQASVETEPVPTLASVRDSDLDMSDAVQKTLEGLRGDAFLIARDIGLERLLKHDGIDLLIQKVKDQAFPLQGEEASELFRQGQLLTGPLSKQSGEPMLSYISRRRRWWVTLRELDPEVRLSEAMRANLLVELSGLSRQEQLMVRAAAQAETVDAYARVLIKHHSVVHMRERLLVEKDKPVARTWSKPRWENTSFQQKPRYGYMTQGFMEDDEYEYQGLGSQAYVAEEHEVEEDEGEWVDDSALALALNAYTAMQTELGGEPGEEHAEALQLAYAAQTTLANVKGNKGKGFGKSGGKKGGKVPPSNLSIADRKAKLAELKARSRCLRCGAIGHWAGDAECRFKGSPGGPKGSSKGGPGAEKSASPGKPGMASSSQAYLAALSDASDDETPAIHLSNTSRDMEGYPAERSGGPSERPRVRRSEATAMRDSPPPGSDTLFTFGHHKGLTYERVLHTYPGYVLWGQTQKCPSKCLGDFLNWVHEYYVVEDTDPIEVRRRDIPLSTMMPPTSVADRAANAEGTASSSTGFRPKCRGGCKTFSKTGSNSYIDMRTCKSCGTVTKTRKEQVQVDPTTCTHAQVDRSGSSKTTSRIKCKLCGMILDELPQEEKKARDAAAAQLRDTNTLDFDMMRSIVGRTGDRVPVEVVVPALEQFKEAVEGHFVTEPSITRGDLFAYLQEALDDHADDASPTSASWEMASSGRRPGTAMVAMLAEPHEGVTDTNPSLSKLPVVNIRTSPHVFAVLDEGCNSTVHGEDWGHESMSKYASFGYSTRFAKETSKTFKGLSGSTSTLGTRTFPFCLLPLDSVEGEEVSHRERLCGALDSHEIPGGAPLLLSLHAQSQLGMAKDLHLGTCSVRLPSNPDKTIELKLHRTSDSGLLCICLTDGLLQGKQPRLVRGFAIPPPPAGAARAIAAEGSDKCANSKVTKRKASSMQTHSVSEPQGENTNLTAAMAIAPSQRPAPKARPQQLNSETFPTEGGDNPKHAADIFTFGYNFEEAVDKIRNAWEPQHFADMFSEMRSAEATLELGGAFVGIFFDLTYLPNARSLGPELADRKRDTSLRDHVGSHPSIMKAIAADPGFLQHCRAIRSKVKKSMEQGYQAMNISVVCKQNRHRSVAGGILIEHMLLRVEGLHVSMQHCNSEQSWPLMGGSCRGHCSWCTHRTDDAKAAYEQVLADFIKYLEGDVKENTTCILHCESEPERAPGTAPEEVTDLDADDEVEEVPSDPLEVAPGEGESASQAATRLGLRGKQHTSYVAKWDPSSLTGRLHQQAGSGVFTATSSHLPVQAQVQTLERKLALRDKEVESLRSKLRDAERDKQEAERRAERAEQLLQDALAQFGGRSRSRHRHHDRRARSSSSDSRRKVRRERSSHHDDHRAQSSRRESSSYRDRDRDQWHPSSSYRDTARETSSYDQNQWDAWDDEWSRAGDWDHQAPPEPPKPPVRRWTPHLEARANRAADEEFWQRRFEENRPPGQAGAQELLP